MKLLKRNTESRKQGALIPVAENLSQKGNYISQIVKKKLYNYYNLKHRVAVCKLDPLAEKLTYLWADRVIAKTFKFYTSHEVGAVETMQDIRAKWIELNADEILNKAITPMVRDGFALIELLYKNERIDYFYGHLSRKTYSSKTTINKIFHRKSKFKLNRHYKTLYFCLHHSIFDIFWTFHSKNPYPHPEINTTDSNNYIQWEGKL